MKRPAWAAAGCFASAYALVEQKAADYGALGALSSDPDRLIRDTIDKVAKFPIVLRDSMDMARVIALDAEQVDSLLSVSGVIRPCASFRTPFGKNWKNEPAKLRAALLSAVVDDEPGELRRPQAPGRCDRKAI